MKKTQNLMKWLQHIMKKPPWQRNIETTTHNDETTQNNDKQPHKKVMAFYNNNYKGSLFPLELKEQFTIFT